LAFQSCEIARSEAPQGRINRHNWRDGEMHGKFVSAETETLKRHPIPMR
jgi:hypothetical protein